jgi:hypothetical protein
VAVVGALDGAVEIELHDVVALDQFGAARAREQKPRRIGRMAHAHVAIGVHRADAREHLVGNDEIDGRDIEGVVGWRHDVSLRWFQQ